MSNRPSSPFALFLTTTIIVVLVIVWAALPIFIPELLTHAPLFYFEVSIGLAIVCGLRLARLLKQ